jgi:hypothetical protein
MRFADMSLDVIYKWRLRLHIYSEKEAGSGGKRGKKISRKRWKIGGRREAVESAGRKQAGGGKRCKAWE